MEANLTNNAIQKAVTTCLEGMVFSEASLIPSSSEENFIPWETIEFKAAEINMEMVGKLILALPNNFAEELVQTVSGPEVGEINSNMVLDIVAELLNNIAGIFVENCYSEGKTSLSIPKIINKIPETDNVTNSYNFKIDENKFSLIFEPITSN